jgi:hypothetical protein
MKHLAELNLDLENLIIRIKHRCMSIEEMPVITGEIVFQGIPHLEISKIGFKTKEEFLKKITRYSR